MRARSFPQGRVSKLDHLIFALRVRRLLANLPATARSVADLGSGHDAAFLRSAYRTLTVIEHFERPRVHVAEMYRLLRPGGTLLLTTPSRRARPVLEFMAYRLHLIDGVRSAITGTTTPRWSCGHCSSVGGSPTPMSPTGRSCLA